MIRGRVFPDRRSLRVEGFFFFSLSAINKFRIISRGKYISARKERPWHESSSFAMEIYDPGAPVGNVSDVSGEVYSRSEPSFLPAFDLAVPPLCIYTKESRETAFTPVVRRMSASSRANVISGA